MGNIVRPDDICEQDWQLVLPLAETLFVEPTRPSRDLATEFSLSRQELVRLYRIISKIPEIQQAWTFDSPLRRRISFLRRELLPANSTTLKALFNGDVCLPNHVEFHPALICNLRCKACPNCRPDDSGNWHFIGYQESGDPLTSERLQLLQEIFLDLGVSSFSFGGGGEPSLSALTIPGIINLRKKSAESEVSLYTNGIFPESWGAFEHQALAENLNKIRFSIDAANAREWSQYKGRSEELFETLWQNIARVVQAKRETQSSVRIGASCLISNYTTDVEAFLQRARDTGLDFCDIKEIETCYGDKPVYQSDPCYQESMNELLAKIKTGLFAPLDVVIDDNLLRDKNQGRITATAPNRCWASIRGRMLTIGPYSELYPCSDAANPGSQYRRAHQDTLGQLSSFASATQLREEFLHLWDKSLEQRNALSKNNCAYCVPSHNNYNLAVEKLFVDWQFGIMPNEQPFAAEQDHYQRSRGLQR